MFQSKIIILLLLTLVCVEAEEAKDSLLVLAIPAFSNLSGEASHDWLNEALADMLTTDFASTRKMSVVSRVDLKKILSEQELSLSGLVSDETSVKAGELVGAGIVLSGSYTIVNTKIRLDAKVFSTAEGIALGAASVEGKISEIFMLEKILATKIIKALNIELDMKTNITFMQVGTENPDAIENNYKGIIALDANEVELAKKYFTNATSADPFYKKAKENLIYASTVKVKGTSLFGEALAQLSAKEAQQKNLESSVQLFTKTFYEIVASESPEIITKAGNDSIVDVKISLKFEGSSKAAEELFLSMQNISEGEEKVYVRMSESDPSVYLYRENFTLFRKKYYEQNKGWFPNSYSVQLVSDTAIVYQKQIWVSLDFDEFYDSNDGKRLFLTFDQPRINCGARKWGKDIQKVSKKYSGTEQTDNGSVVIKNVSLSDLKMINEIRIRAVEN
jgi:TolB-like protein